MSTFQERETSAFQNILRSILDEDIQQVYQPDIASKALFKFNKINNKRYVISDLLMATRKAKPILKEYTAKACLHKEQQQAIAQQNPAQKKGLIKMPQIPSLTKTIKSIHNADMKTVFNPNFDCLVSRYLNDYTRDDIEKISEIYEYARNAYTEKANTIIERSKTANKKSQMVKTNDGYDEKNSAEYKEITRINKDLEMLKVEQIHLKDLLKNNRRILELKQNYLREMSEKMKEINELEEAQEEKELEYAQEMKDLTKNQDISTLSEAQKIAELAKDQDNSKTDEKRINLELVDWPEIIKKDILERLKLEEGHLQQILTKDPDMIEALADQERVKGAQELIRLDKKGVYEDLEYWEKGIEKTQEALGLSHDHLKDMLKEDLEILSFKQKYLQRMLKNNQEMTEIQHKYLEEISKKDQNINELKKLQFKLEVKNIQEKIKLKHVYKCELEQLVQTVISNGQSNCEEMIKDYYDEDNLDEIISGE